MQQNDTENRLLEAVLASGATHAAMLNPRDIVFNETVRDMCAMNSCGHYGKCWVCPPAIGPVSDWSARVVSFDRAVVLQTVYQLEDSFDYEGMMEASKVHSGNFHRSVAAVREGFDFAELLTLNAGNCSVCEKCTYPDAPCRFPDRAVVSVEACGIDVNNTLLACGLHYNNGRATVSYVGMILFRE